MSDRVDTDEPLVGLKFQALDESAKVRLASLTRVIIAAAIRVHRSLGLGLLESVYEACLAHELIKAGLGVRRQPEVPVVYDGVRMDVGFRMDLLVEEAVVIEIKAVDRLIPIHDAQLITYLRLSDKRIGLILNFNTKILKQGIRRLVN